MRFHHFESLDSTNAEAKRQAKNGNFGPLWILADVQTQGRGRRGRDWVSQKGNLFCTGLYPRDEDLRSAALLSFVAALAVAETLDQFIAPKHINIKWPNDVQINCKKIAGILLESGSEGDHNWVAIGIGINLVSSPKLNNCDPTNLLKHIDETDIIGAEPMVKILAERFECWRALYLENGFTPIKEAWLKRARGIGEMVTVNLHDQSFEGIALGMDDDGALEVQKQSGETVKIHAGDVFFS